MSLAVRSDAVGMNLCARQTQVDLGHTGCPLGTAVQTVLDRYVAVRDVIVMAPQAFRHFAHPRLQCPGALDFVKRQTHRWPHLPNPSNLLPLLSTLPGRLCIGTSTCRIDPAVTWRAARRAAGETKIGCRRRPDSQI